MKQALSGTGRLLLTLRTNAPKKDVVTGKLKSVSIADLLFQSGNIFHIHIKKAAACFASYVIMRMAPGFKTICSARNLDFADSACFGQAVQVPVHSRPADGGVFLDDLIVDLVGGGMAPQFVDCLQNQGTLNRISLHHRM